MGGALWYGWGTYGLNGWGSYDKVSCCFVWKYAQKIAGLQGSTLSNHRMTTRFGPFELPTCRLLQRGRDYSPPKAVSSGGAPTPAGTSVFTEHNWDMGMGYLSLNGWSIYGLLGWTLMT